MCFILNNVSLLAQKEVSKQFLQPKDTVYKTVDSPAEFPGGNAAWNKYQQSNFNVELDSTQVSSTLIASFIVHKDVKLSDITIQNAKPGRSKIEAAYVKLLREVPNWIAAKKNGRNVTSKVSWSITICLTEE
jgi:protein TonB